MILNNKHIFIFVLFVLLFTHCSGDPADGEIPVETIVFTSFIQDSHDAEDILFEQPGTIELDHYGNIYIFDSGAQHILKFSPEGEFIQTIGQKGEGPGEFMQVRNFAVDHGGNIYTFDFNIRRVSIFNTGGEYLSSFPVTHEGTTSAVAVNSHGKLALLQPAMDKPLVNLHSADGTYIRAVGMTPPLGPQWDPGPTEIATMNMNQGFIRFNSKGEMLLVFRARSAFRIYSPDGELSTDVEPEGTEIDSLRVREAYFIDQIQREHGLGLGLVVVVPYFSGVDFIDDNRFLINLVNLSMMYEYSTEGKLIRKYKLEYDPGIGLDEFRIGSFAVDDGGTIFGVDAENLAVMRGRLNPEH